MLSENKIHHFYQPKDGIKIIHHKQKTIHNI